MSTRLIRVALAGFVLLCVAVFATWTIWGPERPPAAPLGAATNLVPPKVMLKPEGGIKVPPNWSPDIQEAMKLPDVEIADAAWVVANAGESVGLNDREKLVKALRDLQMKAPSDVPEEWLDGLRGSLTGVALPLFEASTDQQDKALGLAAYAKGRTTAGQALEPEDKASLAEQATQAGFPVDAQTASDEEVYAQFALSQKHDPAWGALRKDPSRALVSWQDSIPTEPAGQWMAQAQENIRTYNPLFGSRTELAGAFARDSKILFADYSLVIERTPAWGDAISVFFLRFWRDTESGNWQLLEASCVQSSPSVSDATYFVF